ncbi:uncharacterized protein GJ701_016290 isoform 3-T3 [Geothlypis trichas]
MGTPLHFKGKIMDASRSLVWKRNNSAYLLNISLDQSIVSSNRTTFIIANEEDGGDSEANSPCSCYSLQLLAASHSSKIVFRYGNKLTTKKKYT